MALNSTSTIRILDLLCEGPIQGIVGQAEGVYLDETPIKTGSTNNFLTGSVSYDFRSGGRTQSRLPQAPGFTSTIESVNLEIGQSYSETLNANNQVAARDYGAGFAIRQITDQDADFVKLLFTIPRLYSTAVEGLAKGQLFNASIYYRVSIQDVGRGTIYEQALEKVITGISTSSYQVQTPRIELKGTGPWNVRVDKLNVREASFEVRFYDFEDVDKATPLQGGRANQFIWTNMEIGQEVKTAYPYCAVAGLDISTEQFDSLPTRAYLVKGRTVQIPANMRVREDGSLQEVSSFNGKTKSAWTTCPVCCWRDMLTNKRYGAGDFVATENTSWTDLYPLIKYSNELVATPEGDEPRFAINTAIGNRTEAFNVLQDMASVFRGMLYWQANTIQATADHGNYGNYNGLSSVHLYNNSNVVEGLFNYSGTSLKTRSTSIRVRYNDPSNFYKSDYVVIEDATLISKYGYQVKEVVAFGTTSQYQAQRLGRWLLASEELEGETVQFSTGLDGAVVIPGQIFAVADQTRQAARIAGRVRSATTTSVVADQTVSPLISGSGHTLTCVLPDGTVETKGITSVSGETFNLREAFSEAPQAQSVWSLTSTDVRAQKFRCISAADNGDGTYSIVGVVHNDSIYEAADKGKDLKYRDITLIDDRAAKPQNPVFRTQEIRKNNNTVNRVTASWTRGVGGPTTGYEVSFKVGDGNFSRVRRVSETSFDMDGMKYGQKITFRVRAVGFGKRSNKSAWVTRTYRVPKAPDPDDPIKKPIVKPPDAIDVTIQAVSDKQVILQWGIGKTGLNPDDFTAIIRHSSKVDGTGEWANSRLLRRVDALARQATLPLIEGEYLIKFQHTNKQRSVNAVSAVIDIPESLPKFEIQVRREDQDSPPFQGEKDGTFYSDEYDALVIDGTSTIDAVVDVDALGSFDFLGERKLAGTYYFRDVLDLGGVYPVSFTTKLTSRGLYPADEIDERTEIIDLWSDFDGGIADDTSCTLYFRTSNQTAADDELLLEDGSFFLLEDGSDKIQMESNLAFDNWIPMESGRYVGRQFQFKAELESFHQDQTPLIDELGYTMELDSRTEKSDTIASGAGAKAVTFVNAFYETPNVGITASNLSTGDYYEVTSTSRTGFTVTFRNSSGTAVDRDFSYQAVGYGTEQT